MSRPARKKADVTPAAPAAKEVPATVARLPADALPRARPRPELPPPVGLDHMSRRHWLFAAGGLVALAGGFWPRGASGRVRPPGALPPADFEAACIRCFRCAEVCPPKCIRFDSALDPRASDTPWIDTRDRACILCMKCTEVCPTGALQLVPPDMEVVQARVRMGVPELDRDKCLPWTSAGVCRLCYYACPYPDEAIVLDGPRQAPVIVPEQCTGCGLCDEACPRTVLAIRIVPNEGQRST